jgi:chromosome segregation ATPase
MSIDAALKDYKKKVKESQTALGQLEDRARSIGEQQERAEDARTSLAQVESQMDTLTREKATLKEAISEAVILDDPDLPEMRERYIRLNDRVTGLQDEADRLREVAEDTPSSEDVAKLKAELQGYQQRGIGSGDLERAVKDTVAANDETARARAEGAMRHLPSVEAMTLLKALAENNAPGYGDMYRSWRDVLEREREAGRGRQSEEQLERMLNDRLVTA